MVSGVIIITILFFTIFTGLFPTCFIEGSGLTPFKIVSEYVINSILLASIVILYKFRNEFNRKIFYLIVLSISATIVSELAFTFYVSVFDISNLIGHILKIVAFFFIYKAIIEIGLTNPFGLLLKSMKKSEEKYRKLVEDSLEGIWVIDDETNTTFVNQSMANMFGYEIDEMIGANLYEFTDEDGKKIAEASFERRRQGIEEDHEFEFIHKSGKKVFTTLRASPIFDEDGNFEGAMAFVTDITEQKIAQEKIADMARFPLEDPNPILRLSNKYVLLANKASQNLFGIGEGSRIPEDLIPPVNEAFSKNKNIEMECEIKNRIYNLFIVPIKGKGYANIYGMDITARKEAEDNLGRFVSTVSHELRTPVSVLTMSIEFLENHADKITPEIEKKLKEGISRNIYLLKDLIEDILTLSRIDEGKAKMDYKEYKPSIVIQDILTLMEPIGNEKNITFNVDVNKDIKLYGDNKKIDQIFRILIDNAIKYSRESNNIEIKAIDQYKGRYNPNTMDGVLFRIEDNGIGILEKEIPSIFQRFFRSEQVTDIPGTGLGLPIAKELIELHSGKVYLESEYGKGSIFYVFLPRIEKEIYTN
jgi:PAS domain S-box-containing protein